MRRIRSWFLTELLLGAVLLILALGVGFFGWTRTGAAVLVPFLLRRVAPAAGISYASLTGTLAGGLRVENLVLPDLAGLPAGSVLKAQSVQIRITSLRWQGVSIQGENVRLSLPESSDPVVFLGGLQDGQWAAEVFSHAIDFRTVFSVVPRPEVTLEARGYLQDIDLQVTGPAWQPLITGELLVKRLTYREFLLQEMPLTVNLQLRDIGRSLKLFGDLRTDAGELQSRRTKVLLQASQVSFMGLPETMDMRLRGQSTVDQVQINILVQGTLAQPDIALTSVPTLPQAQLLIMLATGQRWQGVESSLSEGRISAAAARDFMDYFFFAGQGEGLAKRLGLREVTFKLEKEDQGIGVKTDLTDRLGVGVGLEVQKDADQQTSTTTRSLSGEVKVTDQLSVGVERAISQTQAIGTAGTPEAAPATDDKFYLRFDKKF